MTYALKLSDREQNRSGVYNPAIDARFEDEVTILRYVQRQLALKAGSNVNHQLVSKSIVALKGFHQDKYQNNLLLEFCDQGDLARTLRHKTIAESEVRKIAYQIAQSLSFLHSIGVVHRDIKPSNILVSSDDDKNNDTSTYSASRF